MLKGDAFLAEQNAQALVTDAIDHPLGDQEVRLLGQAPGGKRQAVLGRPGLRDLLDLAALGQCEGLGPTALALGVERVEAIAIEAVSTSRTRSSLVNVTSAILATGMPCADSRTIWAGARSPPTRCPAG